MYHLQTMFVFLEAAGGIVRNTKNETLMIYRNSRWDLPKGHCEDGETSEQTALREVEEECGISGMKLRQFITKTYHLYGDIGQIFIKCTYWYYMYYDGNKPPVPQTVEGITDVEWISDDKLPSIMDNVYGTITDVFKAFKIL